MSLGAALWPLILDLTYGADGFTPPDDLYLGLSLTDPGADGTGITEPSGGYQRMHIDNDAVTWAAASGGAKALQIDVDWPQATAAWGLMQWGFISTAAVAGTFYGSGPLTPVQLVAENGRFSLKAGQLIISMGGASFAYWQNKILDHIFGKTAWTPPASIYHGLSQTDPHVSLTEPAGNGYARTALVNNLTNYPAASGDTKQNGTPILSPVATGSWGTLYHHFAADALSGGNLLHAAPLGAALSPGAGNQVEWVAGAFEVRQT